VPAGADVVLLSGSVSEDMNLHKELSPRVPSERKSMALLDRVILEAAATAAAVPLEHPIRSFLSDPEFSAALEDAAFGTESASQVVRRRRARRVSRSELERARQNAERIGRDGEEAVACYLEELQERGEYFDVEWTADSNAASPYDFLVTLPNGKKEKIEVKSTEGVFERLVHISAAEIAEAATSKETYVLYRVFEMNEDSARVCVARDMGIFAQSISTAMSTLPAGVWPDGFSFNPNVLTWGAAIEIERLDDSEDEVD
jgi:hypothetical protein